MLSRVSVFRDTSTQHKLHPIPYSALLTSYELMWKCFIFHCLPTQALLSVQCAALWWWLQPGLGPDQLLWVASVSIDTSPITGNFPPWTARVIKCQVSGGAQPELATAIDLDLQSKRRGVEVVCHIFFQGSLYSSVFRQCNACLLPNESLFSIWLKKLV